MALDLDSSCKIKKRTIVEISLVLMCRKGSICEVLKSWQIESFVPSSPMRNRLLYGQHLCFASLGPSPDTRHIHRKENLLDPWLGE